MEEKKHIDRLFQEKLKDFEVFPEPIVWKNIEQELTKKKRRRIVPLWLRLGGAAAVLLMLISSSFWFFNENNESINPLDSAPIIIDETSNNKQNNTNSTIEASESTNESDGVESNQTKSLIKEESSESISPNRGKTATQTGRIEATANKVTDQPKAVNADSNPFLPFWDSG